MRFLSKRLLVGATIFSALLLLFIYFTTTVIEAEDTENNLAELEALIADYYAGSRFDQVSVDIESGFLDIILEDTTICATRNTVYKIQRYLNLSDFETVRRKGFGGINIDMQSVPGQTYASIYLNSEADARISTEVERKDRIISEARADLGWGQEAANRAYEEFVKSTPELNSLSYEIYETCDGGISIGLIEYFLILISVDNLEGDIQIINQVINKYSK